MAETPASQSSAIPIPPPEGPSRLVWAGKEAPQRIRTGPLRLVETFQPRERTDLPLATAQPNCLIHGDNRESLAHLLAQGYEGKIQLIYIDPPFHTGNAFHSRVQLRGRDERTGNPGGPVLGQRVQYSDAWAEEGYLQFMYERLLLLRPLLRPQGVLWLHCDHRRQAHLLLLLEEVFGPANYLNTVTWRSQVARGAKVRAFYFPRSSHFLHIFARDRSAGPTWHRPQREVVFTRAEAALRFMEDEGGFFRTSHPGAYSFEKLVELHRQGRIYAPYGGQVVVDPEQRRVYASNGGNIGIKYYLERRGRDRFVARRAVDNIWDDIPGLGTVPSEDVNYPTQKTEALLRRIVETSSEPGDLVLDAFAGSGTTLAVAQALDRPWIGCDVSLGAIQTCTRRLQRRIQEQLAAEPRPSLKSPPCFAVYRTPGADASPQPGSAQPDSPLQVAVRWERQGNELTITLESVHNPALEAPLADWRTGVLSVAVDPAYDGQVFRAVHADAPKGKGRLVQGRYRIPLPPGPARVAIKVVDMLGQEATVERAL